MPHSSYKKILLEITLFIVTIILAGLVTVSYLERYVVQNKISDIKNSLDHLKDTVYNMAYAYDELHNDLAELAIYNPKPPNPSQEALKGETGKKRSWIDDKLRQHLNVLLTKAHNLIISEKKSGSVQANIPNQTIAKSAATITRFPIKDTAVGTLSITTFKRPDEKKYVYKCKTKRAINKCKHDCEHDKILFQKF